MDDSRTCQQEDSGEVETENFSSEEEDLGNSEEEDLGNSKREVRDEKTDMDASSKEDEGPHASDHLICGRIR